MKNVITLGKRLLPIEQIALVEPFDPSSNPDFKPEKDFKARVVLLNRDTVLTETSPQEFAAAQGFPCSRKIMSPRTRQLPSASKASSRQKALNRRSPTRPGSNGVTGKATSKASCSLQSRSRFWPWCCGGRMPLLRPKRSR